MREHHRNKKESHIKVSISDVVLVHKDNVKRSDWKMGKVLERIVGKDGVARGAMLKLITKGKPVIVSRAVQKLYPLEVSCVIKEVSENDSGEHEPCLIADQLLSHKRLTWFSEWCLTLTGQGGSVSDNSHCNVTQVKM